MDTGRVIDGSMIEVLGDGVRVAFDAGRRWARLRFQARAEFLHGETVQGGFITAWIDSAMAHACRLVWEDAYMPATLEMKVAFLEPVYSQPVYAEGWIVRDGTSTAFVEGRLVDDSGTLLASATSTVKKAKPRNAVSAAG